MCGIVGFFTNKKGYDYKSTLESMLNKILHRGPDDGDIDIYGLNSEYFVGFGHRRLSIIDLSSNGRQPIKSISGNTQIVFNGEIYNYKILRKDLEKKGCKFKTNTDTEVILNMYEVYGENCLKYFNGMFAFAIFDKLNQKLFIARDRAGIRPLYYYINDGELVFASEIKALNMHPSVPYKVNYSSLYQYVQTRYIRNPDTIFDGIKKLEPGHFMTMDKNGLQIKKYWDVEDFDKLYSGSIFDAINDIDTLLEDSIKLRMISDVPIGAFLSGGLDSSLIVAFMSKFSDMPVKTYSVGFKESLYCELPFAKIVADTFRTDHHELVISHKDIIDNIYKAVWFRDAPVSETADIPMYMLSQEAKKTVSVILTGEGNDELFGGYPKYAYDNYSKSKIFRYLFDNEIISKSFNSLPFKYRKFKLGYNTLREKDDITRYTDWFSAFRNEKSKEIFSDEFKQMHKDFGFDGINLKGLTNLDRMLYYDLKYWLPDNLLERGDKMVMAASVEGRLPFLDYRLIELSYKLEDKFKIKGFNRKFIIKKLSERYIPKEIIYRKKIGFYIPVADWFRNGLKEFVHEHLLSDRFSKRGIFNNTYIKSIVDSHCSGKTNHEKEIWMLLNLEIWFRTFIDK